MASELEREISKTPQITASAVFGRASVYRPDLPNNWKVTLRFKGRRISTDFYGGSAVTEVSAADVLRSLLLDADIGEETFEDYCANFGGDVDSRSSYANWKACRAMAPKLRRFLGEDYGRFASLEH